MKITLPPQINAAGLLPFLALLGQPLGAGESIELNFSELRRVTPAGLAALAATVVRWRRENHPITFEGLKECSILGYLQRMDLFKICGFDLKE